MFCTTCGAPNDENAHRCVSCGNLLARPGERVVSVPASDRPEPPHYLAASILVTLFCCQITGIAAIVYSALTMGKNSAGDYEQAAVYSKKAKFWMVLSLVLGGSVIFVYGVIAIVASMQGSP